MVNMKPASMPFHPSLFGMVKVGAEIRIVTRGKERECKPLYCFSTVISDLSLNFSVFEYVFSAMLYVSRLPAASLECCDN
jgi:hypothetical protein